MYIEIEVHQDMRSGRDILKELDKNQNYNKNKILLNNDSKTEPLKT